MTANVSHLCRPADTSLFRPASSVHVERVLPYVLESLVGPLYSTIGLRMRTVVTCRPLIQERGSASRIWFILILIVVAAGSPQRCSPDDVHLRKANLSLSLPIKVGSSCRGSANIRRMSKILSQPCEGCSLESLGCIHTKVACCT